MQPEYFTIDVKVRGQSGAAWKFVGRAGIEGGVFVYRFGFPEGVNRVTEACMTFLVDVDTPYISLQWASHNPRCATSGDLPESSGTVVMVRAACWSMMRMQPRREAIHLMDDTKLKRCIRGLAPRASRNGLLGLPLVRVSLSYHSVLLYGETWYQRKMGAVVFSPLDGHARLAAVRTELSLAPPSGPDAFDEFWRAYMPEDVPFYAWLRAIKPTMARLYAELDGGSWMTYFRAVNASCGCGVFSILENSFARGRLRLDMTSWSWSIPRATVEGYPQDTWSRIEAARIVHQNGGGSDVANAAREFFDAVDRFREWEDSTVGRRHVYFSDGVTL